MKVILLLSVSFLSSDRFVHDSVDLVEVNHFHDDQAKIIFSQLIWWEWVPWQSEYRVVDWRLIKSPHDWPRRRWERGGWECRWFDKKDGCYRKVFAHDFRETWTQYDPELCDRNCVPQEMRRKLIRPIR